MIILRIRKFILYLLVVCLLSPSFLVLSSVNCYAGSLVSGLDHGSDSYKNAKMMWDYLIQLGFTEQAAAGVLGNAIQESSCDPNAHTNGTDYYGTFQWASTGSFASPKEMGRWEWCQSWCNSAGVDYKTIDGQVKFMMYEFPGQGSKVTLGELASSTDIELVTEAFVAWYERATTDKTSDDTLLITDVFTKTGGKRFQEVAARRNYAKDAFNTFSKSAVKYTIGGATSITPISETNSAADFLASIVNYGLLKETEFVGDNVLSETALVFYSSNSLSASDSIKLSNWKTDTNSVSNGGGIIQFLRALVAFIGILIVIFSTFLYLAYWFDRINNFIEISLLHVLTFGRIEISPDDKQSTFSPKTQGLKVVVHKDIIFICLTGLSIGVLILSGRIYLVISWLLTAIKTII